MNDRTKLAVLDPYPEWRNQLPSITVSDSVGFADVLGTDELPETEKDKDRAAVRSIPRILRKGGYTIMPPAQNPPSPSDTKPFSLDAEFPATVIVHPKAE